LLFHLLILSAFLSTTFIEIPGHLSAITNIEGPPTYPAPMQQILMLKSENLDK